MKLVSQEKPIDFRENIYIKINELIMSGEEIRLLIIQKGELIDNEYSKVHPDLNKHNYKRFGNAVYEKDLLLKFGKNEKFAILDRSAFQDILNEIELSQSGLLSKETV